MAQNNYTRRDASSIYEYLKEQATLLSDGRLTDFSSGSIEAVFLSLMAYLADLNNFQLDKTASELFLDTAIERSSLIAMLKLVGYEPRHYESAKVKLSFTSNSDNPPVFTTIPAYSTFTNNANTITYTNIEPINISNGVGIGDAYEGTRTNTAYGYSDITDLGRIYLQDYKIGMNTIQVYIPSVSTSLIKKVDNVKFDITGDICFSAHVDEDARIYIQLPSFWTDLISESSIIYVSYLLTQGEAGRVGANIITKSYNNLINSQYTIINNEQSEGGLFPETVDEIKIHAPMSVRTMDTIVTKKDLQELVLANIPDIASCVAYDYNDAISGYIQPNDAYKCKVLATPVNVNENSIFVRDENGYYKYYDEIEEYYYWYDATNDVIYNSDYTVATGISLSDLHIDYTSAGRELVDFVNERRLAGLMIEFEDAIRLTPTITLNIYTNPDDLRTESIAANVKEYMKSIYNRSNMSIGKSLYGSTIGRDLLNNFEEITYIEVVSPETNIEVHTNEYLDMENCPFIINVNDVNVINDTLA